MNQKYGLPENLCVRVFFLFENDSKLGAQVKHVVALTKPLWSSCFRIMEEVSSAWWPWPSTFRYSCLPLSLSLSRVLSLSLSHTHTHTLACVIVWSSSLIAVTSHVNSDHPPSSETCVCVCVCVRRTACMLLVW